MSYGAQLLPPVALAALAITWSPLGAAPPTAEQIEQVQQEWYQHSAELRSEGQGDIDPEVISEWLDQKLAAWDPMEMDLETLQRVSRLYSMAGEQRTRFMDCIETIARQPNEDGVVAVTMILQMSMNGPAAKPDLPRLFEHPGFENAARSGRLAGSIGMLAYLPAESIAPYGPRIAALVEDLGPVESMEGISTITGLTGAVARPEAGLSETQRDALLDHVVGVLDRAGAATEDERMKSVCVRRAAFMRGAAARGRLINHVAPEIKFLWVSDESLGTKLADMKGKVVVVDFWATWCGPCIGSFPNVAEMVERYRGYDVSVIGVTSVQGRHYGADGAVDCEGDPQKEFALMKEFVVEKEMTWPVAFSSADVFNPEYGVRGIPHVAILDVEGKVRFNNLHPANPLAEKAEKIDKLLKEAGRPAPAPLPVPDDSEPSSD